MSESETVFVVDDDAAVRDSLELLLRSMDLPVETFASGTEFLEAYRPETAGCLVLDVRMPGISGVELQEKLAALGSNLPIIFITGHGDVPMAVRALKAGAVDFIQKPFSDQDLLDKIHQALELDVRKRHEAEARHEVEARIATLTPRERQVMQLVVEGAANKIIAHRLELSQRTVEIHRAHVMRKMKVDSLARLVRVVVASSDRDT
jgi:FixJ family two-component response regulator